MPPTVVADVRTAKQIENLLGVPKRYDKLIARAGCRKQPIQGTAKCRMLDELAEKRRALIWAQDRERFAIMRRPEGTVSIDEHREAV